LLYHGWHHIYFVTKKTLEFCEGFTVDTEILEAAALTHDLNYLVAPNSEPDVQEALAIAHKLKVL
jgi:HD superfamily phosphodiesterase